MKHQHLNIFILIALFVFGPSSQANEIPLTVEASKAYFEKGREYYDNEEYDEAFLLFEKAVHAGNEEAQYYLGTMYARFGINSVYNIKTNTIPFDYQKAFYWLEKVAFRGHSDAQFFLGMLHFSGKGTLKHYGKAFSWIEKAAMQGHSRAQYWVADMYYKGEGVPAKDLKMAYAWANISASTGNNDGRELRELLETKMPISEQDEAQEISEEIYQQIKLNKIL